jgi:hypothetical protein
MEHEFRSVMSQYCANLSGFRELCGPRKEELIHVRRLSFRDAEVACQNLIDGFVVEWDDEQPTETHNDKIGVLRPFEQQSDRENPIECLETSERGRSDSKEIGGLFCSFDE